MERIIVILLIMPAEAVVLMQLAKAVQEAKADVESLKQYQTETPELVNANRQVSEVEAEMDALVGQVRTMLDSARYSYSPYVSLHSSDEEGRNNVAGLEQRILELRKRYNKATLAQKSARANHNVLIGYYNTAKHKLAKAEDEYRFFVNNLLA